jgi:hypothetical protein
VLDFNPSVLPDVSFWVAILSGEAQGPFTLEHEDRNDLDRFAPSIILSHRKPTISFNISALDNSAQPDPTNQKTSIAFDR